MALDEKFYSVGSEPIEKTKWLIRQLYQPNIHNSWSWFDKLDCKQSWHREPDPEMTLDVYISSIGNSDFVRFVTGREEYPHGDFMNHGKVPTIQFFSRSVHLKKWMMPAPLGESQLVTAVQPGFVHEFYPRGQLVDTTEATKKWVRVERWATRMKGKTRAQTPEEIKEELPTGLQELVMLRRDEVERFAWWFCPQTPENYALIDGLFQRAYTKPMAHYIIKN